MRLLLSVIFLLHVVALSAQTRFTLSATKGCDDFTVVVTDIDDICTTGTAGCFVNYDYPDGTGHGLQSSADKQHTYTEPGTYRIELLYSSELYYFDITVFEDIQPDFAVGNCAAGEVALDIIDTNYDRYRIDWGDGQPATITTSNATVFYDQYTPNTTYTITVTGIHDGAEDNCTPSTDDVTVLQSLSPPTIRSVEPIDASTMQLEFDTDADVFYKLDVALNNRSTFQQIASLTSETSLTLPGVRADQNFYCFRLGAHDLCNNQFEYSEPVCSVVNFLSVENNQNVVTWNTDETGATLRIEEESSSGGGTSGPSSATEHIHRPVNCGTEYCYRVFLQYRDGPALISEGWSLPLCGVAISEDRPPAISDVATIVENGVTLEWLEPDNFNADEYFVYQSLGGYHVIDTTTELTLQDASYTTGNGACYKITYNDICGNASAQRDEVCPLNLSGALTDENHVSLSWNAYTGYGSVARYVVEKYTVGGTLLQSTDVSTTTFLDESEDLLIQQYVYVVKAVPAMAGISNSVSNEILIIKEPNIYHPTSFTPNGDNTNDLFRVWGQYVTKFEMDIFNRWGELMFTTNDIENGWDGSFKGNDMPEGTYTFVARLTDFAGREFKRSGSVLLLRKK